MKRRKDGRKDRRSGARWSKAFGPHGGTINLYEELGGVLYISFCDPATGKEVRRSLGHGNRKLGIQQAQELAAKFVLGVAAPRTISLGWGWDDYLQEATPRKTAASQQHDHHVAVMTKNYFGADLEPGGFTRRRLDQFVQDRLSGAIDSHGNYVADPDARRPVSPRTVERDLATTKAMWQYHEDCGHIDSNPIKRLSIPKEEPTREVASDDRADAIEKVAPQITMMVSWFGDHTKAMSSFRCIFRLARETGRRIYPILCLRFEDLELERTPSAPWGAIVWPQDTDKQRRRWRCPLNARAREAIDWALEQRPMVGPGYLFPSRDLEKPIRYELALTWLRRAEALAGLEAEASGLSRLQASVRDEAKAPPGKRRRRRGRLEEHVRRAGNLHAGRRRDAAQGHDRGCGPQGGWLACIACTKPALKPAQVRSAAIASVARSP